MSSGRWSRWSRWGSGGCLVSPVWGAAERPVTMGSGVEVFGTKGDDKANLRVCVCYLRGTLNTCVCVV